MKSILKLGQVRVRRTYSGGKILEQFFGNQNAADNDCPEDWVISTVSATNVPLIENEGLTVIEVDERQIYMKDYIRGRETELLGEGISDINILVKLIDAAERLSIQVHPTIPNAIKYFNSKHGKTECWYILGKRDDNAHIYFGFKEGITKEKWKRLFEADDAEAMLECLHKFKVNVGECYYIRGGVPHAIGAGCFLAEIQEPTDYTLRTERHKSDGSIIPDKLITQGIGEENMLNCFDYKGYALDEIKAQFQLEPHLKSSNGESKLYSLVDDSITDLFAMDVLNVDGEFGYRQSKYSVTIVLDGSGEMATPDEKVCFSKGDKLFLTASCKDVKISGVAKLLICHE